MSSTARSAQPTRRRVTPYGLGVGAATAAFGLLMVAWALMTPSLRAPDESAHLNSIIRLEYGGGWPAPGEAQLTDVVLAAQDEAGVFTQLPRSVLPYDWSPFLEHRPPAEWTVVTPETAMVTDPDASVDQMTQHPPTYYAIQAAVAGALPMDGLAWRDHLMLARGVSILMMLPIPVLIAGAARRLTGSSVAAVLVALIPAAVPQVAFIGGSVSNDAGIALAATATLYLVARALADRLSWTLAVGIGLALGVALLMKGFALVLIPAVILGMVLAPAPRLGARVLRTAVAMVTAFAVGGWWWALNVVRYGVVQPDGLKAEWVISIDESRSVIVFARESVQRLIHSFFGVFGGLELPMPDAALNLLGAALIATVGVGVVVAWRIPAAWVMLSVPVTFAVFLFASVLPVYMEYGNFPGLQGRYLFSALLPIAVLVAWAFAWVAKRPRRAKILAWVWAVSVSAVATLGLVTAVLGFYTAPGDEFRAGLDVWRTWVPGGDAGVVVAVASTMLAVGAALCVAVCAMRLSAAVAPPTEQPVEAS